MVGGDGTGLRVKARFEAFPGAGGNPNNTRYTILQILNAGENYAVGNELSFPDQGGYSFSGMGELVKLLTVDFSVPPSMHCVILLNPLIKKIFLKMFLMMILMTIARSLGKC